MRNSNFPMTRGLRQSIIAFLFLSLTGLLFFGVYHSFIRVPATCNDGIRNQNEQGIDCGGSCAVACQEVIVAQDLVRKEVSFVPGGNDRSDVLVTLYNPNDTSGASSFRYTIELHASDGQVLATRTGTSYILPQETKDLIEIGLPSSTPPLSVTMTVSDATWERFSGYQEKPNISIYQKHYAILPPGAIFSQASGLLSNESLYDFRSISVAVILRDSNDKLLAINKTRLDNIKAGEQRDFTLPFPAPFPGTVEKIDMEADADAYHSDNLMKQYLPGGQR